MPNKINPRNGLTPKQKAFARYYVRDFDAKKAALEAGYSKKMARNVSYELLRKPAVRKEVDRLLEEITQSVGIDSDWVLRKWMALYERCVQEVPVRDKKGNFLGEYRFDSSGAAKALEAIGRYTGGFDRQVNVSVGADDSLRSLLSEISGETMAPPRERSTLDGSFSDVTEDGELVSPPALEGQDGQEEEGQD